MKKIVLLLFAVSFGVVQYAAAQKFSTALQLGWSAPKGEAFNYDENTGAKGGLGYSIDLLYYLPALEEKLAVGLVYNGSLLLGGGTKNKSLDIDMYGLALYGVKGQYRFLNRQVSPYVALSTGLSHLETPSFLDGDGNLLMAGRNSFSLGLAPEVGVELGFFILSATYFVPMKYKVWSVRKESAGTFQVSLGFRYSLDLKETKI